MYELYQAGKNTYYVNCYATVGIYVVNNRDAYLIDSGGDGDDAKKLLEILDEHSWKLRAVILTHAHADHAGGCRVLQEESGCEIYTTEEEKIFSENPFMLPTYLSGGFPPREMLTKFFFAGKYQAKDIKEAQLPEGLEYFDLPGHNFHMIGVRTSDHVVFLADAIFSYKMLQRYHINFIFDVPEFLKTLDKIKEMRAELFVPSHVEPMTKDEICTLADANKDKVDDIVRNIVHFCQHPITYDELMCKLFDAYGRKLDMQQYYLVGFTLHSYLSWLKEQGSIQTIFEDNVLCWRSWHA